MRCYGTYFLLLTVLACFYGLVLSSKHGRRTRLRPRAREHLAMADDTARFTLDDTGGNDDDDDRFAVYAGPQVGTCLTSNFFR